MTARRLLSSAMVVAGLAAMASASGTARADISACPSPNPPNELALIGGSGQTAQLGTLFDASLQVQPANSDGCPLTGNLAGIGVTFDAPAIGASGIFAGSGSNEAMAGTDAQGLTTAPAFTANFTAGSYTIEALSQYGSVGLSLSNTVTGLPAAVTATGGSRQTTAVSSRYAQPLRVRVTDANGNPVQGASVSFAIAAGPSGATAAFLGAGAQTTALTDSSGIAISPELQAATTAGSFIANASVAGIPDPATFALRATAARPATIAAGAASGESTLTRTRFRVPLAVTVTDRYGNPVAGTVVTFTAPRRGASGSFAIHERTRSRASRVVHVRTNCGGIAVAPRFTANRIAGGYIVRATVHGAHAHAAFALVNNSG